MSENDALARFWAHKYLSEDLEWDDLLQSARRGMLRACETWDPERGKNSSIGAHASAWARAYVQKEAAAFRAPVRDKAVTHRKPGSPPLPVRHEGSQQYGGLGASAYPSDTPSFNEWLESLSPVESHEDEILNRNTVDRAQQIFEEIFQAGIIQPFDLKIVQLYFYGGLSYRQVGAQVGRSYRNTRYRVERAIKAIKESAFWPMIQELRDD